MQRNSSKYKAIIIIIVFHNSLSDPRFVSENIVIPLEDEIDLLGVMLDSKLKLDMHVAKICRKVSQQEAILKTMKKLILFESPMKLHQALIVPHFHYCAET